MDEYKKILIDLVEKCRNKILQSEDYVMSLNLLKKINESIIDDNPNSIEIDYNKIITISNEEMSLFSTSDSQRFIKSLPFAIKKAGISKMSILRNIKKLEDDLNNNKIKYFDAQIKMLGEILDTINNNVYLDNYKMVLDFIELSLNNGLIDIRTAINLNFYVLRRYNSFTFDKDKEDVFEVVNLEENSGSVIEIRSELIKVFNKYGYSYDVNALDLCGGEENFVKYAKISYVDYILSKFKRYGITQNELYVKKSFYNIIIDNDKATFNSMLDFVDHNACSLNKLLYLPAVFSKRVREYVVKSEISSRAKSKLIDKPSDTIDDSGNNIGNNIKIVGCNGDFLKNINLYKELKRISAITDDDLNELGVFLSTPHVLVKKNLKLLLKYKVVTPSKLPDAIVSLCGKRTEYLLDRFIESSIYEEYLLPRFNRKGELRSARGTSLLYTTNNPLMFYKIKKAIDVGDTLFHSNTGLRNVFTNDNMEYRGISIADENRDIQQRPMTMDEIDSIDYSIRKYLPSKFFPKKNTSWVENAKITFNNLYKYRTFSPTDLFVVDKIKGNIIEKLFERDYYEVTDNEEDGLNDSFIKMLDNAVYCDVNGDTKPIKLTDLQYVFIHPSYPNTKVIISRYKVLRLCKLLKDNDCWINEDSLPIEKENILLSILLKDSIVSEYEMVMLRFAIRKILSTGLIKVDNTENIHLERRVIKR